MPREMVEFFALARNSIPSLHFLIISQSDPAFLRQEMIERGFGAAEYTVMRVNHADLGAHLAAADAAIAFVRPMPSKVASSPTKIGEYLAAGLPVVASAGVGDVDELLASTATGVSIEEFSPAGYRAAVERLSSLLYSNDVRSRCVETAGERLSLDRLGVPRYDALYHFVSERGRA
jgi:glycosyltransferase involved in cell wall biosynthesis